MVTLPVDYNKKRINVSPVGFEFDRIFIPLKEKKYDKVILISHKGEDSDRAENYFNLLEKEIKGIKIEREYCDVNDLYDSLSLFYRILKKEKGNEIWINLSSGSKVVAMAGMLSSMMFGEENTAVPFYVVPKIQVRDKKYNKTANEFTKKMEKKYKNMQIDKPESFGVSRTFVMPRFKIEKTDPELINVLRIINKAGGEIENSKLKNELVGLGKINIKRKSKIENKSAPFVALKRKYLDKMSSLIEQKLVGREKIITLTEEGKNLLKIYGENFD